MNSFDILEELGNLDDDLLLRAQEAPPKKRIVWFQTFRNLAAACLMAVLVFAALIATDVIAMETGLRWTVRYREDKVTWLFKDGVELEGDLPNYEPTWLPEDYMWDREYGGPTRDKSISYRNLYDEQSWIWLHYMQITDKETYYLSSLDKGTYEKETVEINGLPGELYTYVDDPDSGYLIWIDKHNCTVFLLGFDSGSEDVIRIAESVKLMEEEKQ